MKRSRVDRTRLRAASRQSTQESAALERREISLTYVRPARVERFLAERRRGL